MSTLSECWEQDDVSLQKSLLAIPVGINQKAMVNQIVMKVKIISLPHVYMLNFLHKVPVLLNTFCLYSSLFPVISL